MTVGITNRTGNFTSQQWTADIITGGAFTHKLISVMDGGIHRLIIRDTNGAKIAEKTSNQPMSVDTARDFADQTLGR